MEQLQHIKHVFFDLDHTLWDFETNSQTTLHEMFDKFELPELINVSFEKFLKKYKQINDLLWVDYRENKVTKNELRVQRFYKTLLAFDYSSPLLAEQMADYYVNHSPYKTALFPGAVEVLEYLNKKYDLHIISNGFREVQHIKLKNSKIVGFFKEIVLSEDVGVNKPNPEIFHYLLKKVKAEPSESVMIGDNIEADIKGAAAVGIPQILFNPKEIRHNFKPTFEITHLSELKSLL
ncbi:MAG TPA: noncanonical pyrimidine nucleotidase, YjjG family [Flavobacteriales bacterium]|nr:noncanonical pyrimidine nucleotidase, YjjG family [Flavobacteriales bacterium]|tara:strand:+ start:41893 stop:42597 length:705 start_codon:yes stop_codon:yes gene_type:complete